jgi:lipopolysaccharide export system permease protein
VVILMIGYACPYLMVFVLPMSTMMAILLTFLRLSNDNEITALKSGGVSFYRLLPPVFFFSLFGFFLTSFMTLVGVPWGNVSLEKLALKVLASNADIGLKERTFNDSFENVMLYVNKIDVRDKKIIDIFIEDKRQAEMVSTVVAPEGRIISDPDKSTIHLQLYNGTIHQTNLKNRSVNSISFDTYHLNFELNRKVVKFEDKEKDADEMELTELREYIKNSKVKNKDYWKAQIVFHRKFAYPIACFALGLSAMPLGIQSGSVKRSFGLAFGLFFFFFYYMLLSTAMILGETGKLHPAVGMYLPIVITGLIGWYLFNNTAKERTIPLVLLVQRLRKLASKFRRT